MLIVPEFVPPNTAVSESVLSRLNVNLSFVLRVLNEIADPPRNTLLSWDEVRPHILESNILYDACVMSALETVGLPDVIVWPANEVPAAVLL